MRAPSEPVAPKRILYIDDDEGFAFLLKSALEQCGHQVTTYAEPATALKSLFRTPGAWDMVISDYAMPGSTGFEVARAVRERHPGLRCAVISTHVSDDMVRDAARAGVSFLCAKPATPRQFSELIARVAG